jgi:hypothetical protein
VTGVVGGAPGYAATASHGSAPSPTTVKTPTSAQTSYYESELVYDIAADSFPFAANEYAVNGYHLPKQSYDGLLQHWLAPTGYESSGARTVYEDPGWGNQKSVSASSSAFVVALGGRGYVF